MKELSIVKLKNDEPYKIYNLYKGLHGIVMEIDGDSAEVLFFNPHNIGDYAIIKVKIVDLDVEKEKLPSVFERKLLLESDSLKAKAKNILESVKIKEYETVELIVENEKYSKYGVHKGDRGCVTDNNAVQNYIEVDFTGVDKDGNYYGDCISVKIDDLKVVE